MIFYQEKYIELYLATLVKGVGCTPQISEDLPNILHTQRRGVHSSNFRRPTQHMQPPHRLSRWV